MGLQKLTFVLGGANSGKSAYAERVVETFKRPKVYLATAQAFDDEMTRKIQAHRRMRGDTWETVETPLDPAAEIKKRGDGDVILLDCLTLWLSNLLLAEKDIKAEIDQLVDALVQAPCPIVIVSNEAGMGIVPENALARRFRTEQGRLNQRVAAEAGCVVTVIAGLPLVLKGDAPL